MNKRKAGPLFLLTLLVCTLIAFYFYREYQPVVTYSNCPLCDGNQYMKMYDYFAGKTNEYQVLFPYYSRIMVPFLASIVPGNSIVNGFQIINLVFSLLGVGALFLLWKKLEIPWYLMSIAFIWLLFHWTGLIRLNAFDPITVDLPTYLVQTLFIFIVFSRNYYWLLLIGPLAVLQRESITVLLMMLLVYEFLYARFMNVPFDKKAFIVILVSLVLTIIVKYIFSTVYPALDTGKSSVRLVLFYIKEILIDPFKLIRWLVGVFMAFGVLFMAALVKVKRKDLNEPITLLFKLFTILYLLLGLIAGGDFTRIVFLGFPFIMTWILLQLRSVPLFLVLTACGLSVFQMRIFKSIPDQGKDFNDFASWYPEFASSSIVIAWLVYFGFCFIIIYFLNQIVKKLQARNLE